MNWNPDDPLFEELFRFSLFLHANREKAMQSLEKAFQRLIGKPEAAERQRASRFLFMQLRRSAPKPVKTQSKDASISHDELSRLRILSEPDRSLAGLFYATSLSAQEISRILGHPQQDLAKRLCLLRRTFFSSDTAQSQNLPKKPTPSELQSAFDRPTNELPLAAQKDDFARRVDVFWLAEFSKILPNPQDAAILTDWANHLQTRAASWKPSPRDPAMIGLACALVFLVGIVVWTFLGSQEAFHGKAKVLAILDEGVAAAASEYEPVSGNLGDLGDWLALQGVEGVSLPPGFAAQRMIAARIFPFEGTRVATVLLPDSEMVAFIFDGGAIDVEARPVGEWKIVSRGQDSAAIIQNGAYAFMVAVRASPEDLERQLDAISAQ